MKPRRGIVLISLTVFLWAAPAVGSVVSIPYKINLKGTAHPARAGEAYQDILQFSVGPASTISNLRLKGEGWKVSRFWVPTSKAFSEKETFEIPFTATPKDPTQPLVLSWTRNGERESKILDVSPDAFERARPKASVQRWPGGKPDNIQFVSREVPIETFTRPVHLDESRPQPTSQEPTARTITVTGRITCLHEDDIHQTTDTVPVHDTWVTAKAYQNGLGPFPTVIASDKSNADGYFSIQVNLPENNDPIIVVWYSAINEHVNVEDNAVWSDTWSFASPPATVSGSTYDTGTLNPSSTNGNAALYIAESYNRAVNWLEVDRGVGIPQFIAQWPESDGSYYSGYYQEIHIGTDRRWLEDSYFHEFGHYYHDLGAGYMHDVTWDFYCNGFCDDVKDFWFDDCGHCLWCPESGASAFNEGFANFMSRYVTDYLDTVYSSPDTLNHRGIHSITWDSRCPGADPAQTEGFFAAALYDLVDFVNDPEDDPAYPGYVDDVSGWEDAVFDMFDTVCDVNNRRPRYPFEYLQCFMQEYGPTSNAWEVFKNNGFDLDLEPPGVPINLTSWPPTSTVTTDNTVLVEWTWTPDDASGIEGYSIEWDSVYHTPDQTLEIGNVFETTSPPLSPGTWYCSIRAKDRRGNWSDSYAYIGPFYIAYADPADLISETPTGWDYPIVPRNDNGTTFGNVHLSTSLDGGDPTTYWNVAGYNGGDEPTPATTVGLLVDGKFVENASWPGLGGGVHSSKRNLGPVTVHGGRHIFGMFLDESELSAELDEANNYWAGQFVWRPDPIVKGASFSQPPPPAAFAGTEYFGYEQPLFFNCDGWRLTSHVGWQGAFLFSDDPYADYDLRLFSAASLPEDGFGGPRATSLRPFGTLDAVIVNAWQDGINDYNIGALNSNWNAEFLTSGFRTGAIEDINLGINYGTYTNTLSRSSMMRIYSFFVDPAAGGSITFKLFPENPDHTMYLGYFPPEFGVGDLLDADQIEEASDGIPAVIHIAATPSQYGAVVVWREPTDGSTNYPRPFDLVYEITPPDPATYASRTWAAPIVPRPNDSIVFPYTTVPAPTTLNGEGDTYLYMSEKNQSVAAAPQHDVTATLDGANLVSYNSPTSLAAYEVHLFKGASPVNIRGGRHTLGLHLDEQETLAEILEINNFESRQWVWRPPTLSWGSTAGLYDYTDITGGWDGMGKFDLKFYNCVGYRTPRLDALAGEFSVIFLGVDDGVDADLRLHDLSPGATSGFAIPIASSTWTGDEAEYIVLVDEHLIASQFDAAIVQSEDGGAVLLQAETSSSPGISGARAHGPFTMDPFDFVDIHELTLPSGTYEFRLVHSDVNLGFALHEGQNGFENRSSTTGTSWGSGSATTEVFRASLLHADTVPLVVWRADEVDTDVRETYSIVISGNVTAVDDGALPATTRVLAASPNPFASGGTEIVFELSEPQTVNLSVYDMRGTEVCRLGERRETEGRHLARWDGCDGAGRPVAAGLYFVRMYAGGVTGVTKVIKLE